MLVLLFQKKMNLSLMNRWRVSSEIYTSECCLFNDSCGDTLACKLRAKLLNFRYLKKCRICSDDQMTVSP